MQVQGNLFSKAVPAADISLLLRRLRLHIRAAQRALGSAVVAAAPDTLFPPGRDLYSGA